LRCPPERSLDAFICAAKEEPAGMSFGFSFFGFFASRPFRS
jgi:hypothetical protein